MIINIILEPIFKNIIRPFSRIVSPVRPDRGPKGFPKIQKMSFILFI